MAILKKTIKIVLSILLALVFLSSIVSILYSMAQRYKGYVGIFGYTFEIIATDSMSGTLEVGDIAVGRVYDPEKMTVDVGTIITFKAVDATGRSIKKTHRVYEIKTEGSFGNAYFTRGDNVAENQADSGFRLEEDIISINQGRIRYLGRFILALKTTVGYISLTVLIGLYILYEIGVLINNLWNNKKKQIMKETYDAKETIIQEYLASQQNNETSENDTKEPQEPDDHSSEDGQ